MKKGTTNEGRKRETESKGKVKRRCNA